MFGSLEVPFGARMLFNTVKLKPGVPMEEVELAIGEMCNVVKNTYGGDKGGFVGSQVFKDRFSALATMCTDSQELGYETLWQGRPEDE